MANHRHGLCVTTLEGPIYAIGGHDGMFDITVMLCHATNSNMSTFGCLCQKVSAPVASAVHIY